MLLLKWIRSQGVVALSLNGQSIFPVLPEITHYEIELPELAERNVLVLEIEMPEPVGKIDSPGDEWGMIALVVRRAPNRVQARRGPSGVFGRIRLTIDYLAFALEFGASSTTEMLTPCSTSNENNFARPISFAAWASRSLPWRLCWRALPRCLICSQGSTGAW